MANSLTPLISEVINAVDEIRFDKYGFTTAFAKDFMPDGALTGRLPALNDAVTITGFTPTMYRSSGQEYTVSGRNYSVSTIYEANATVKFQDGYSVGAGRLSEFEARLLQAKVKECLKAVESGFAVAVGGTFQLPGTPNFVGTAGTAPFATPWADVVNANIALHRNNCPENDRHVICDLNAWTNLLNNSGIWRYDAAGEQSNQLREAGFVPTSMGVDFKWTNTVAQLTGSLGSGSGYIFISGLDTAGVDSGKIYISGTGTGNVTIYTGTIFWVGGIGTGYGQSYVTLSGGTFGETGATNGISVPFYPPLRTATTENTGITLSATTGYVANLMFHRDAYKLIMRNPLASMGGRTMNAEYIQYVDPRTGVPLLIGWHPGDLMGLWTVKALFQWVPWTPEWSCIIAG
jgi:hypothetical protein